MLYITIIALNCFVGLVSCDCSASLPNLLHEIKLDVSPAFTSLIYNVDTKQYDLGVSSFTGRITVADQVLRIPEISNNYANLPGLKAALVTNELVWPNEVKGVPESVFGDPHFWDVANAFFLPGKNKGCISVIDMTDPILPPAPVPISSEDGKDWYYHRVLWEDMDYDGDLDAVSERAYGSGANAEESQSVWFENPGLTYPTPNWKSHVIYENSEDVAFRLNNEFPLPDGTMILVLISAGFYSHALTLTWPEYGNWSDPASMNHVIIDNFGWYFDVQIIDLNADGKLDILTTTWSQPGFPGSVLAYERPSGDWRTDMWTRHILSMDFKEANINGNGSPGSAQAFWPTKEMEDNGEKPYIAVSGDDDGKAYLLIPDPEPKWTYTQCTMYNTTFSTSTVGAISVGDVDQDGFTELFIPWYTGRQIAVMTYRPQ